MTEKVILDKHKSVFQAQLVPHLHEIAEVCKIEGMPFVAGICTKIVETEDSLAVKIVGVHQLENAPAALVFSAGLLDEKFRVKLLSKPQEFMELLDEVLTLMHDSAPAVTMVKPKLIVPGAR